MPTSTVTDSRSAVENQTSTVELPDVLMALRATIEAGRAAERIVPALAERIERSRRRSARARMKAGDAAASGNGHAHDLVLKLTARGIEPTCRRCGRTVGS
jgi:hypothetical protein